MSKRDEERKEACEGLRAIVKPGDTLWTVLRHVSRSRMSRDIDVYLLADGEQDWLTRRAARAAGLTFNEKRQAIRMGGCGMDMGFALVYELSSALYPDGFGCIGDKCPSNDHANGDRDQTPHTETHTHWHRSGGYALRHRWL